MRARADEALIEAGAPMGSLGRPLGPSLAVLEPLIRASSSVEIPSTLGARRGYESGMDRHVADSVTAPATSAGALRMPALVTGAAFLACYVLLDATSVIFPRATFGITPWNPSTGLAWAFILLFGQRYLALLFVAPFLADVLVFGSALPWWTKLLAAGIVGAGYAAALLVLLHPKARFNPALATMRDMVLLMGIAVVATGLVALAYVTLIVATGDLPMSQFQWSLSALLDRRPHRHRGDDAVSAH